MKGLVIRAGGEADIERLLDIERLAASLLLDGGHGLLAMHSLLYSDIQAGIATGILRVAEVDGLSVGFALCGRVDAHAHLFEMDVVPEHGRRGIGAALLEAVWQEASRQGHPSMTLATLRDVPWNAPFYARHGFVEFPESSWGPQLHEIMRRERMLGFPMHLRVVMQRG